MPKVVSYTLTLIFAFVVLCSSYVLSVYAIGLCDPQDIIDNCSYTLEVNDCNCPPRGARSGPCYSNGMFLMIATFGLSINAVKSESFWEEHKAEPTQANAMVLWNADGLNHTMVIEQLENQPGFIKVWDCRNTEDGCVAIIMPLSYYSTHIYSFARF